MNIAIIGRGTFGTAIASVLAHNTYAYDIFDQDDVVPHTYDIVFVAVPTQMLRKALIEKKSAFSPKTIVVSCTKGIERETKKLPFQIFAEVVGMGEYHTLSGPSFATEIQMKVPTLVDVAGLRNLDFVPLITTILNCSYFKIEQHDSVHEIELAGALKNVYAIAAGFLAGVGGGNNTHAHLQVVALREYQRFIVAFGKTKEVVCPSIVGDLYLTCGSVTSRNYRFGLLSAQGKGQDGTTVEGTETVWPLLGLAEDMSITLPLAQSVAKIVRGEGDAKEALYESLGFSQ